MLVAKFSRFGRKGLDKQTHIDNFLYFLYIFLYLKKNSVNFRTEKSKKNVKIIFANFLFFKFRLMQLDRKHNVTENVFFPFFCNNSMLILIGINNILSFKFYCHY